MRTDSLTWAVFTASSLWNSPCLSTRRADLVSSALSGLPVLCETTRAVASSSTPGASSSAAKSPRASSVPRPHLSLSESLPNGSAAGPRSWVPTYSTACASVWPEPMATESVLKTAGISCASSLDRTDLARASHTPSAKAAPSIAATPATIDQNSSAENIPQAATASSRSA